MNSKRGQSFFDMVVQTTGSIDEAFAMTVVNNREMTGTLDIDTPIIPTRIADKRVVQLFKGDILPASAFQDQELMEDFAQPSKGGIGKMIIGSTFRIG